MTQVLNGLDAAALAAIATVRERFVTAVLAADWDTHLQLHDEQVIVMPPHLAPLDPVNLRLFVENYPKITAFSLTSLEIDGRGDLAYERGRYDITAGGVTDQGSYLRVWRQRPDGSWKVFRDMWHSDLAAPRN